MARNEALFTLADGQLTRWKAWAGMAWCDTGFMALFWAEECNSLFSGEMDLIRFVDFSRQFFFDKLITLSPVPLSSL